MTQHPDDPTQPGFQVGRPPQVAYPPPQQIHLQQPVTDKSKRFLNLSGGALLAVITGILIVCCVGPIVLCFASPFLDGFSKGLQPAPTVLITSCNVADTEYVRSATMHLKVTNNGTTAADYTVHLVVKDANGVQVGSDDKHISTIQPNAAAVSSETIFLDAPGGQTCSVAGVD